MTVTKSEELVKRIARLAKQNKELTIAVAGEVDKKESSVKFNMATVLFADIHGFTKLVEGMDSSSVMDELDEILFEYDSIVDRYKIEKIKTIGDTYMCAGGIPVKNITNPIDVVMAAMEMRNFLERYEAGKPGRNGRIWDLKIGIHTGPVTASISGKKKINYDIKGDTVHTASRVEAMSDNGMILISVMSEHYRSALRLLAKEPDATSDESIFWQTACKIQRRPADVQGKGS